MPTGNADINERHWDIVRRVIVPNDERYPAWLHINKSGTTTMSEVLRRLPGGVNSFFPHDYPIEREVLCMWRNPFDRIESTYRMYVKERVHGYQHYSWEEFVRTCCRKKDLKDPHMLPQYEVCTSRYGRFVPDRVLLWDWEAVAQIYGIEPEVRNHTPGNPQRWPRDLRIEFEERFWLDIHIWNKVPD